MLIFDEILLISPLYILYLQTKVSKDSTIYFTISFILTLIYITFFMEPENMKNIIKYLVVLLPIYFTVLIFGLNFYSMKIFNKPFSYYYSKYNKSIIIIFIPLIILIILIFFNIKEKLFEFLIVLNSIFYTFILINMINDVFCWNKGKILRKFKVIYEEALIEMPFKEIYEKEFYFQFQELKNIEK